MENGPLYIFFHPKQSQTKNFADGLVYCLENLTTSFHFTAEES